MLHRQLTAVTLHSWLLVVLVTAVCTAELAEDQVQLDDDADIPVVEGHGGDMVIAEEDDVLVLTDDTFLHVVSTRDPILVEFYAPWCGHCKSLAPEYAKAAQQLKEHGIRIAKVDASQEVALGKEFDVTGYPTLKLFRGGKPAEDYDGARTAEGIVQYMRRQADPDYKPPPTAVVELTEDTFEGVVYAAPLALVAFTAPWCGHCKTLAPEYESAAVELRGYGVLLARVDVTSNKELADQFGVTGYPTLKVFRHRRVSDYKGGRDVRGIVDHMRDQQRLPSQEVRSAVNARNAVLRTQPTALGCFGSAEDALYEEFIAAANDLRGQLAFVHTFDAALADTYGVPKGAVGVVMPEIYRSQYEESIKLMEQSITTAPEITAWMGNNSVPLLGERRQDNEAFLYSARPLLVVYGEVDFSHQHIGATQHLRNRLLPLFHGHQQGPHLLTFALSNEEPYSAELERAGLGDSGEDVNIIIYTEKAKYPMEPSDDYMEELESFMGEFAAGRLRPYIKSQPAPLRQIGNVKVLVGNTFEKEVVEGSQDYLLEFYAPWCGHCKKLEPIYKQLANHLKQTNVPVTVAKFDATANDLPAHFSEVKGFPTIYYVKGTDLRNPILFDGGRTLDELKEFVQSQQQSATDAKEEL